MLKEAEKNGLERWRQETAFEYAQRLANSIPDAEVPAQEITNVYCSVRYTESEPPEFLRKKVLLLFRQVTQGLRNRVYKRQAAQHHMR